MLPRKSEIALSSLYSDISHVILLDDESSPRVAVYALGDHLLTCSSAVSNAFLPFTVFTTDMVVVYYVNSLICGCGSSLEGKVVGARRFRRYFSQNVPGVCIGGMDVFGTRSPFFQRFCLGLCLLPSCIARAAFACCTRLGNQ